MLRGLTNMGYGFIDTTTTVQALRWCTPTLLASGSLDQIKAPAGGWPMVVFFYGGGWVKGDRGDHRFVGRALASRGIIAVVPDYRLVPQAIYPAQIEDVQQAVAPAGGVTFDIATADNTATTLPFEDGFEDGLWGRWWEGWGNGTREVLSGLAPNGNKSFHFHFDGPADHFTGIHQIFPFGTQPGYVSFNRYYFAQQNKAGAVIGVRGGRFAPPLDLAAEAAPGGAALH